MMAMVVTVKVLLIRIILTIVITTIRVMMTIIVMMRTIKHYQYHYHDSNSIINKNK